MKKETKSTLSHGMDSFIQRIQSQKELYEKILEKAKQSTSDDVIYRIADGDLLKEVLHTFGSALNQEDALHDLTSIYETGLHKGTGALIINNKGATLYSLSPKTYTPYLVRHIGLCVYMPGLGIEFVNVGLSGDVYDGKVVLRSESACTPSFIFGSQRCNCAHQWDSVQELAASFNKVETPDIQNGILFEKWVQSQLSYADGKHQFINPGQGFVMMHVDTQNGMGSGYTKDEFAFDLYTRASIRHRGEYTSEQVHSTSMAGGFEAIGIRPDPRRENKNIGYQITGVILDYLGVSKDLIFLSNNPLKIESLEKRGYSVERLAMFGEINPAGAQEAKERGIEFEHLEINGESISFKEDFDRIRKEIESYVKR